MPASKYLTKERLEELKQELETLKGKKRLEIADRLRTAKEYGDLSENAEYAQAREEQALVETRIFELEELLPKARIIEKSKSGMVEIGSGVTVQRGNDTFRYIIVGSYEAKPEEGKISDESPLGKAFIHKKIGDKVTIKTPGGSVVYEVLEVS